MPELWQYAIHTQRENPSHRSFWAGVEASLTAEQLASIGEGGRLRKETWLVPPAPAPAPTAPARPRLRASMRMPCYSQRDSTVAGQAMRMCFSSSNAMALEAIKPGTLLGPNGDDAYLKVVMRFGDTTSVQAQLKALEHFGVKASFTERASWEWLLGLKVNLSPEAVFTLGFLHKGPVSNPVGGGHWLGVKDIAETHLLVNDPFGEIDLVRGVYLNTKGCGLSYSRRNFNPRWSVKLVGGRWVETPNCGYAMVIQP